MDDLEKGDPITEKTKAVMARIPLPIRPEECLIIRVWEAIAQAAKKHGEA